MTDPSRIDKGLYWDRAWSLTAGCTPVSPGCDNCWSAREAHMRANQKNEKIRARYAGLTTPEGKWNGRIRLLEENLDLPLRVKKATVWAIWNGLFHPDVPDEFIQKAFAVMFEAGQHTYLLLTKRPDRMAKFIRNMEDWNSREAPHIWFGVTCENQKAADERIPILLQIPAAVRFVSCEPLLEPIDLREYLQTKTKTAFYNRGGRGKAAEIIIRKQHLNWVICGGETGPGARPMHPDWVRSLRDQAVAAGVPFFFKQWGEFAPITEKTVAERAYFGNREIVDPVSGYYRHGITDTGCKNHVFRVGRKAAGRLLDGMEWNEVPNTDKAI